MNSKSPTMNCNYLGSYQTRLIISESEQSADMFYATKFRVPDEFIFLEHRGKSMVLLPDLEIDRGRCEAKVDEVFSFSDWQNSLLQKKSSVKKRTTSSATPSYAETVAAFIKKYGSLKVVVPATFPLGLARALERAGVTLKPVEGMLFPERQIKQLHEIKALKQALRITEAGLARAYEVLRGATIGKKNLLSWQGTSLTSERLRCEVEETMQRAGGIVSGSSIIACGEQACDPHERGYGNLYAHKLIILDFFPRHAASGYYGDMTRTVVRGKASAAQRHLWDTCLAGQKLALRDLKPGASGKIIHQTVQDFFTKAGYPTEQKNGRWSGFFHNTGHGLGLDLHEAPRFNVATFTEKNVFAVEPGIYIPGVGGVRHEDVALITKTGYRLLSRFPKELEI
ncbi:MAG: M24 family metallopeptidase [Chthoniobacterales bacterium]